MHWEFRARLRPSSLRVLAGRRACFAPGPRADRADSDSPAPPAAAGRTPADSSRFRDTLELNATAFLDNILRVLFCFIYLLEAEEVEEAIKTFVMARIQRHRSISSWYWYVFCGKTCRAICTLLFPSLRRQGYVSRSTFRISRQSLSVGRDDQIHDTP